MSSGEQEEESSLSIRCLELLHLGQHELGHSLDFLAQNILF